MGILKNKFQEDMSAAVPHQREAIQGKEEPCQPGPRGPEGGTGDRLWLRWRKFCNLAAPKWDYNTKWTWLLRGGKNPLFSELELPELHHPRWMVTGHTRLMNTDNVTDPNGDVLEVQNTPDFETVQRKKKNVR